MGRPVERHVGVGRQQLAARAIEHVEETVLGRLHQHFAGAAVDRQVRKDNVLGRGVIPVVAGRGLVVPDQLAGFGSQRQDRCQVQVVPPTGTSVRARPGRAVAGSDVQQVEFRVVGHRVPGGSAPAHFPPLAIPGFDGAFQLGVLERLAWIAGHGVEAPGLLARVGAVSGDVTSHEALPSAVSNDYQVLHAARCARDRVGKTRVGGLNLPVQGSARRVQREQTAVNGSAVDGALPQGNASVHHVATGVGTGLARDFRGVPPQQLAAARVQRTDHAPVAGHVHAPVCDDRSRLDAAQ